MSSHDSVGLDSQCLTYMIDAMQRIVKPEDSLADERISLVRVFLSKTFFVSESVLEEVAKIRVKDRRALHDSYVSVLFIEPPVSNRDRVERRAGELFALHPHDRDCRILAEAEDLELKVLLSYDKDFLSRLGCASDSVRLLRPSVYWRSLRIPRGKRPSFIPHRTNALSKQNWWKW